MVLLPLVYSQHLCKYRFGVPWKKLFLANRVSFGCLYSILGSILPKNAKAFFLSVPLYLDPRSSLFRDAGHRSFLVAAIFLRSPVLRRVSYLWHCVSFFMAFVGRSLCFFEKLRRRRRRFWFWSSRFSLRHRHFAFAKIRLGHPRRIDSHSLRRFTPIRTLQKQQPPPT